MGANDGFMLEFLYPKKTMALLKRMSVFGWDTWDYRHAIHARRQYSTPAGTSLEAADPTPIDTSAPANSEISRLQSAKYQADLAKRLDNISSSDLESMIRQSLQHRSYDKDTKDFAWQIYSHLPAEQRNILLRQLMVQFLAESPSAQHADRSLEILKTIPPSERTAATTHAAIKCYLQQNWIGLAVDEHSSATQRLVEAAYGTQDLLLRLVTDRQWELVFRVASEYGHHAYTFHHTERPRISWILRSHSNSDAQERALSLLEYVKTLEPVFDESRNRNTRALLQEVARSVLEPLLTAAPEELRPRLTLSLLDALTRANLVTARAYNRMINAQIKMWRASAGDAHSMPRMVSTRYSPYEGKNHSTMAVALYRNLIRHARTRFINGDKTWCPSHHTFHQMFLHARHVSSNLSEQVMDDWAYFRGEDDIGFRARDTALRDASYHGDVDRVHKHLTKLLRLREKKEQRIQVEDFHALLQGHARRRGGLLATINAFEEIKSRYHLEPDSICYKHLLDAYAKADLLKEATGCLIEMLNSGIPLHEKHLIPILRLCAMRGDVDAVYDFMAFGEEKGLKRTSLMLHALVLAYVKNDDLESAMQIVEKETLELADGKADGLALRGSWNTILTTCALRRDIDGVIAGHEQMKKHGIRLDADTYAALMQVLTLLRQPRKAWQIMTKVLPKENIEPGPFHFSIVMAGYANQHMWEEVLLADHYRRRKKVPSSPHTKLPYIKARMALLKNRVVVQSEKGLEDEKLGQAYAAEESKLENQILADLHNAGGDQRGSSNPTHATNGIAEYFYGFAIQMLGRSRSVDSALQLFGRYMDSNGEEQISIRFIESVMSTYGIAGDHEAVEKCWEFAYERAEKLANLKPVSELIDDEATDPPVLLSSTQEATIEPFEVEQSENSEPSDVPEDPFAFSSSSYPNNRGIVDKTLASAPQEPYDANLKSSHRYLTDPIHPAIGEDEVDGFETNSVTPIFDALREADAACGAAEQTAPHNLALEDPSSQDSSANDVSLYDPSADDPFATTTPPPEKRSSALSPTSSSLTRKIYSSRTSILNRALSIYMRTLYHTSRIPALINLISSLQKQGYTLDTNTWNLYIQILARTGRILEAFQLCEEKLMPQFPGWRRAYKEGTVWPRNAVSGYTLMRIDSRIGGPLTRPGIILPRYLTLVTLAGVLLHVRRMEAAGYGTSTSSAQDADAEDRLNRLAKSDAIRRKMKQGDGGFMGAVIVKSAPRTVRALETMPKIDEGVQHSLIRGQEGGGGRRFWGL